MRQCHKLIYLNCQKMKYLTVVALALRNSKNEVLIVQRPDTTYYAGYWEFPGGKIDPHETPEQALCREIKEEINLIIHEKDLTPIAFTTHQYSHAHVTILLFNCTVFKGELQMNEGQPGYVWIQPSQIHTLKMPEGNYKILGKLA